MTGLPAPSGTPAAEPSRSAVTHREVIGLALPMTIGFLTVPLLGITDTAVAGRLGDPDALAGLALGAVVIDLAFATFNFLRSATTGLTAQAWGRGDHDGQEAIFFRSLMLALALGLVIAILSPLLIRLGELAMQPSPGTAAMMATWLGLRLMAAPASLANFAILGFLLGQGRARTGLALQALINGVNIVLCIGLGLWAGYGMTGIAWATVTGETVGMLAGLAVVLVRFRTRNPFAMTGLFDRARLIALFQLNADIMIRSFALLFAFSLMARIGNGLGAVTLAANAVLMNIFMVAGFFLDGLANAAETIVGRSIGTGRRADFDRGVRLTALWSFVLAGLSALFFLVFGTAIVDLLTTDPVVRAAAHPHVPLAALTALTGCLAFHMDGVFIGATWSRVMRNRMLASLVGCVAACAILVPPFGNTGLWWALNIFLALRGVLLLAALPPLARQTFNQGFSPAQ